MRAGAAATAAAEGQDAVATGGACPRCWSQPCQHGAVRRVPPRRNGKGTCFAYGQTGSGKTFTMAPLPMRAAQDIFRVLALPAYAHLRLHVSCYEIYGGKVRVGWRRRSWGEVAAPGPGGGGSGGASWQLQLYQPAHDGSRAATTPPGL